jgi:MSHA biogenesis protein MshE
VHIEPQEANLQIRLRVDGVLQTQTHADKRIGAPLAQRIKLMAGLDISEKRMPQDGRFAVRLRNQTMDVRLSTLPGTHGESVVMRLLSQQGGLRSLDHIGMPPEMLQRYRDILHQSSGMILVTGPTGSGKTSTLYASLAEINTEAVKIITVEDPVEYRLSGITQVQINEKIELDFAKVLRATLRQDPDVILLGEIRDSETADIGLRAAITGHMVLSTLHTRDAVSTPFRLLDMGVPPFMVATSLQAVSADAPPLFAPAAGTSTPAGVAHDRRGLELTVAGPYPELMRYVQSLEQALPNLRWGALVLSNQESTGTQLTLQVFMVEGAP